MRPIPPPPLARPPRRSLRRLATAAALTAALAGACTARGAPDDGKLAHAAIATRGEAPAAGSQAVDGVAAADPGAPAVRPGGLGGAPVDQRKIVRSGHLTLTVAGYDAARDRVEAIVRDAGGFIDSTRVSRAEGQVSNAVVVVRIPASAFGDLLPKLRAVGDVAEESTDAADITEAYVDTAGRLAGARALEHRLLELAATGTGTVSEVLEVERELSRIRGDIEQLEGRLRVWNDQVSLSTLTLTLSTRRPELVAAGAPSFGRRMRLAWHDSVTALGGAVEGLALTLIALLPWLPLLLPAAVFGVRFLRRRVRLPRAAIYMPAGYAPPGPPPPGSPPPAPPTS